MTQRGEALRQRWSALGARERKLVIAAAAVVALALAWMVVIGPALSTLRSADQQHRALDAQLQRMLGLQSQARLLQSQPQLNHGEAMRQLEASVRQTLGPGARMSVVGERVTLTLSGSSPEALARWLTQARVNARATPGEAHLSRNAAGQWQGTLVLSLPPRA